MVSAAIEIPALPEELATMKDEGNEFFRSGEYLKAAGSYTKAIKNAGKDATERVELAPVFSNRSASFLKLCKIKQLTPSPRSRGSNKKVPFLPTCLTSPSPNR